MFDIYARSIFNATRFSPFTRPLPQADRDQTHREGDQSSREREARLILQRFTFWV